MTGAGIVLALALAAALYARGAAALRRTSRTASGRTAQGSTGRTVTFAAGLALVALALASPLDALAERLFAAHMAQHMLLWVAAAPLLALARPGLPLLLGLPAGWRRRLGRLRHGRAWRAIRPLVTRPLPVLVLQTGALWLWHLPAPFQAALEHPPLHGLEHASFLATAVAFWAVVARIGARAQPGRGQLGFGLGVLYVFVTALQASALGALLTLAPVPLYPAQALGASAMGVSPLADQQLAGMAMWVPADAVYLATIVVLMARWLARMERETPRQEVLG